MSVSWIVSFLSIWLIAGCIRFYMMLGNKGNNETLFDKFLLLPVMPLAVLLGFISLILEKVFGE